MEEHLIDACEQIDAAIFTGDTLYQGPEVVAELTEYVERWKRAIDAAVADDITDYTMRQGEMGSPDRQR